jgi:carboxypeptidase PM20D1
MKRALPLVLVVVLTLAGVLLARTLAPPPPEPAPFAAPSADVFASAALAGTLGAAIRCRTLVVGDPPRADPAAFDCLHGVLRDAFPRLHDAARVVRTEVGDSLLFEWTGADPTLAPVLLLAHQDVVPANEGHAAAQWTHEPFAGVRAGGHVWGRGALDDKGPLVTLLAGVERLLAEGHRPRSTLLIALGHDEESGGPDGAAAIAALLERRGVRAAYALDEGLAVTHGVVPGVARPVALVGAAEKGYLTLRLVARRPPGHTSIPGPDTAIAALARALVALEEREPLVARVDGVTARQFELLAPELPFVQRLGVRNLWLLEPVVRAQFLAVPAAAAQLRTTQAITVIDGGVRENVLPAEATATVNYRVHPRERTAAIVARARRIVEPFGVAVEALVAVEPSPASPLDGPAYQAIARAIRTAYPDAVVVPSLVTGATDGRHYVRVADAVYRFAPIALDPADVDRIHGVDERIAEAQLPRMAAFYYTLVRETTR